ncbi:MAG: hypothetical protein E6G41_17515 [Actinobacteria bacterium]|nr:MAG: hypothetical protein E6G41_17515 [Actinomycetota bacterium]
MAEDAFLEALTVLETVLADNADRAKLIKRRIARLRASRAKGMLYTESVISEDGPLIVQLVTDSATELDTCGAEVRRTEAQALHDEGLTMAQIAERFGVTRQRVSTLLRQARA